MARKVGAASSGSSLASKSARKDPTRASSSPTCKSATPARCTKTSIADAARPKSQIKSTGNASRRGPHSCTKATANRSGLFLHAGAYWLMWGLRMRCQALDVARRPVRHLAPAPHQDRRPRRRNENDDPRVLADLVPGARYSAPRFATHTAPRHLNDRGRGPSTVHNSPFNPQTPSDENPGPKPERNQHVQTLPKSTNRPQRPCQYRQSPHNPG